MPVIWGLSSVILRQSEGDQIMLIAVPWGNQCVHWQDYYGVIGCSMLLGQGLPVRNSTWGQIKGLYR
jgi:hypothetical protein